MIMTYEQKKLIKALQTELEFNLQNIGNFDEREHQNQVTQASLAR